MKLQPAAAFFLSLAVLGCFLYILPCCPTDIPLVKVKDLPTVPTSASRTGHHALGFVQSALEQAGRCSAADFLMGKGLFPTRHCSAARESKVSATAFLADFHTRDAPSADTNSRCGVNEHRIVFDFQTPDGNFSSLTPYVCC